MKPFNTPFATLLAAASVALPAAFASASFADVTPKSRLNTFAWNVIAGIGADGRLDATRFDCDSLMVSDDAPLLSCRDVTADIGFLLIPSDAGDAISITAVYQPDGDAAITATNTGDLIVKDRAGHAALGAEFAALFQTGVLANFSRCVIDPQKEGLFAVLHPLSKTPVTFRLAPPDDQTNAWLQGGDPPEAGTIVGTILVINRLELSCSRG